MNALLSRAYHYLVDDDDRELVVTDAHVWLVEHEDTEED